MKFTIETKTFIKALNDISFGVDKSKVASILSGVLITVGKDKISFISCDSTTTIESSVNSNITVQEEGDAVIDFASLNLIKKFPNGVMTFSTIDEKRISVKSGKAKAELNVLGTKADFVLNDADEFSDAKLLEISSSTLKKLTNDVFYAIAKDDNRPVLRGILVEKYKEDISFIALDGYRLSISSSKLKKGETEDDSVDDVLKINENPECSFIVDGNTLNIVSKIMSSDDTDTIKIQFTDSKIRFVSDDIIVITSLLVDKFVQYKGLMPQSKFTIKVDTKSFVESIERCSGFLDNAAKGMVLNITKNNIEIVAKGSTLGIVSDEVECQSDTEMEIAFNSSYLLDALKGKSNDIDMELASSITPCLFKYKNRVELVLPIRMLKK